MRSSKLAQMDGTAATTRERKRGQKGAGEGGLPLPCCQPVCLHLQYQNAEYLQISFDMHSLLVDSSRFDQGRGRSFVILAACKGTSIGCLVGLHLRSLSSMANLILSVCLL